MISRNLFFFYMSLLWTSLMYSVTYVDSMSEFQRILGRHNQVIVYAYYLPSDQSIDTIKPDGKIVTSISKRVIDLNKQKVQDALILSEQSDSVFVMLNMHKGDLYKFSKRYELDKENGDSLVCFYKNMLREIYDVEGEVDQIVIRKFIDGAFDDQSVYRRGSNKGKHHQENCDDGCHGGGCHGHRSSRCHYSYPRFSAGFGVGFYNWPGYRYRRPWWGYGGGYGYY